MTRTYKHCGTIHCHHLDPRLRQEAPSGAPMTKPVQIKRYTPSGFPSDKMDGREYCYANPDGSYVLYADHQAALLQVREMLKAKAKEWDDPKSTPKYRKGRINVEEIARTSLKRDVKRGCANELLALAATLGNQGK